MTPKPRLAAVALTAGAVALGGCGGGDSSSDRAKSPPAKPQTQPAGAPKGASGAKTVEATMKNTAFEPKALTAKVGQTIKWTNDDSFDHNVTATEGEEFKSKNFGQGGTYSYKLDKPGKITYVCTLHPGMTATITATK